MSLDSSRHSLVIHVVASCIVAAYFASLFLFIPIATEARAYIFYDGAIRPDAPSLRSLATTIIYPSGGNSRVISMLVFALSHHACGLNTPCLNAIQIILLLLAFAVGMWHLQQLVGRPSPAAIAMIFWAISAPVFASGYWQATQHDKLAFVFAFSALAIGLSAIRRPRDGFPIVTNLGLMVLFMLAINAKEIAFFLPVAAGSQAVFLAPGTGLQARLRAAKGYVFPIAYAVLYITIYMTRLQPGWRGHVMSGSVPDALYFDMESLSGRHPASAAALVLMLLLIATSLVAVGTRYLCQNDRPADADPGYARISLYLLTVLLSSLALVARAKYPSDYYLMVPGWALVSWIACTVTIQSFDGPVLKCMTWAVTAALAAAFVHARITDYGVGGAAGQQVRDAKSIYAGYNVISRTCPAGMSQGLKLAFTRHPVGEWWFFRGVAEHPDQLVGAYICHDGQVPPMAYSFDGNGLPDHPGQVVAKWDNNFVVTSVSKHGAVLYSSADH